MTFSLGVVSIDQFVPSQDSTSICPEMHTSVPVTSTHSTVCPTAIQLVELAHDTLEKKLLLYFGRGVESTDQIVPSQDSTSGISGGLTPNEAWV